MHYVIEEENNATLRTPVLLSRGAKKFYGHTGLCSGVRIGNSTILGRLLDDIDRIPQIDAHIIVTNHKFAPIFDEWAAQQHYTKPINRK